MDLQFLYTEIVTALQDLGMTEIEVELKPKNTPQPRVKLFISCETKPETSEKE